MKKQIRTNHRARRALFGVDDRHALRVSGFVYVERLASCVGCRPSVLRTAFTDPVLAMRLFTGVLGASQYRLRGPHRWYEARRAVMSTWRRILCPLVGERQAVKIETRNRCKDMFRISIIILIPVFISIMVFIIHKVISEFNKF